MRRVLRVLRYPAQNPPYHQTRKHPIKPTHPETLDRDEYVSQTQEKTKNPPFKNSNKGTHINPLTPASDSPQADLKTAVLTTPKTSS